MTDKTLSTLETINLMAKGLNKVSDSLSHVASDHAELGLFRTYIQARYPDAFQEAELWVEEQVQNRLKEEYSNVS